MSRSFWGNNTFHLTFAKVLTLLGYALSNAVGHERSWGCAAWGDTHPATNQTAAQCSSPILWQLRPSLENHLTTNLRSSALEFKTFFHRQQNLADTKQTNHSNQEVKTTHQFVTTECQA